MGLIIKETQLRRIIWRIVNAGFEVKGLFPDVWSWHTVMDVKACVLFWMWFTKASLHNMTLRSLSYLQLTLDTKHQWTVTLSLVYKGMSRHPKWICFCYAICATVRVKISDCRMCVGISSANLSGEDPLGLRWPGWARAHAELMM